MGHISRLVSGVLFAAMVTVHFSATSALAQDGGRSYSRSSAERGSNAGSSYASYRDTYSQGFRTTETWGHDYGRTWNRGGWEEPIFRKGEIVGERGAQWDRENGHKRDWGSSSGTRWGDKRSSWNEGGHESSFGSGRRTFGGRSWGSPSSGLDE